MKHVQPLPLAMRHTWAPLLGALLLAAGCAEPMVVSHVEVLVDNSGRDDVRFQLRLNDERVDVHVPYTASQPNVKPVFQGDLETRRLALEARAPEGGLLHARTFELGEANWIVVTAYANGTIESWRSDKMPLFD